MRIDLFLKKSRIIKQREAAKQACDRGRVTVNGQVAKPSRYVEVGDRISIHFPDHLLDVEILDVPPGNVSKARSQSLYRILSNKESTDAPLGF